LLELFKVVLKITPKFFRDNLPKTYCRFWNAVIQDFAFVREMDYIRPDDTGDESDERDEFFR